jgi:predicted DNA-binding transcriptional regulator AlpA
MHTSISGFLRLNQVLRVIPVSRSSWWAGVKTGRFPKPIKLGARTTAWREEDIAELVQRLSQSPGKEK